MASKTIKVAVPGGKKFSAYLALPPGGIRCVGSWAHRRRGVGLADCVCDPRVWDEHVDVGCSYRDKV